MKKKLLTLTMILCLVLVLLPVSALAASLGPWEDVSLSSVDKPVFSLAEYGGNLYAGTYMYGVWVFDGNDWADMSGGLSGTAAVVNVLAEYDGKLYAGSNGVGVWVFDSQSITWAGTVLNNEMVQALTVYGDKLYAGDWSGVWVMGGTGWANVSGNLSQSKKTAEIQELLKYDGKLYAGTNDGVWEFDGTDTWTEIGAPDPFGTDKEVYALAEYDGKLYAGVWQVGVWEFDGAGAWTDVSGNLTDIALNVEPLTEYDGKLYAGTVAGLWEFNGADTWTVVFEPAEQGSLSNIICDLAVYNNGLYAATFDGVWRAFTVISTHPQGASLNVGGSHTMSVVATGTNLTYQWYKNGVLISTGGNTDTYVISNATSSDAGSYTVSVTDNIGTTVTSNAAVVTVASQSSSGDPAIDDSSISPKTAAPVRNSGGGHDDLAITLTANGNTLNNLTLGGKNLLRGTDYIVNGSTVTLEGAFLDTLAAGTHTITFDMNQGADPTLTLTISEEPPEPETPELETPWVNPFTDVFEGDWFYDDVKFVHQNGLFAGTSANTFSPQMPMTRGMVVTVLGRLAVIDIADYSGVSFDDVDTAQWYAPYVKWAAELGIVSGVGNNNYAPDANISRQDLAVILYNYAVKMGITLPETETATDFDDNSDIADYAAAAVTAMQKAGIINGKPGNLFDPTGIATRAEVAAMLHRFVEAVQ